MNRPDKIVQLIQEAFPEEGPGAGADERICHDASTFMKQTHASTQTHHSVSKWRRIMKSPITRTAAVLAVMLSAFWLHYQSSGNPEKLHTVLSLLNAASAAENAWFTGEQTVHIVNQIVIYPQHDTNDLQILMENLESNYDQAAFDAFYHRLLTPRGMEFFSLDPNGYRHNHHLELVDPQQAGEVTIEDHIWYDPGTGRYARLLTRSDRVLFAHAFDGHRVYLAQRDDQGKLNIQSDPVTASFSAPKDLAGFLGSTIAEVRKLLEVRDILIRTEPTESTIRGKAVRVYKLSYAFFADKRIPYVQLAVDKSDQSIVKIEFVTNQKTVLSIDHQSRTRGELPTVGWDLSALPASHDMSAPDVTVRHDMGRTGLTVQDMAERATFPVYIFGKDPFGTRRRTIYESIDLVSPPDRAFTIMYETQHDVAMGLMQNRTIDRFVKAQTKGVNLQLQAHPLIATSNGFEVYDLDAKGNAFILNLLFARLNKKAAENRNGYLLRSPENQIMFLGIDGWLPSNELEQLTESLVSAQDYVPNEERIPETVVDLGLATPSDLEQPVTPWLLLGRFDFNAYSSVATDEEARKRAFDDEILDMNTFTPKVRVQDKAYAWTSCYGQTINYHNYGQSINLGAVYGTVAPGICYGRTRLIMSEPTEAVLGIGSPHAVKIWLNGRLIYEVWGQRGAWPDTDLVPVTLRAGENHLVFKVLHSHGDEWRFFCHLKEGSKTLYAPTMEEQARGFMAVQGDRSEPRPRLKQLEVDLGRNERDLVPVKLAGLSELDAVTIGVSGPGAALCTSWVEQEYQLRTGDRAPLRLPNPACIWLEVDSHNHDPGVYELTVSLSSGQGSELHIPGTVTVHDVALPEQRTMRMNPQVCVVNLSWGANDSPEARQRLEVFLDDLALLRSTVCGVFYTYNPANVLHQVKIAGTDQTLHSAGQAGVIDINTLPDLDFSFFDPWIAGAARRDMIHLEISGRLRLSEHERAFAKAVLGNDMVGSDEVTWKTLMWLHSQFRDYAVSRGMTETWAKIDTQLTPETIPDYVQTARRYQTIGYRTYTGTTGSFTREATWLNQLNAQNDAWHMGYGHTPHFFELTRPAQGQAALPLDAGDQVWYHDGANYSTAYEEGRRKAWRACAIGVHGYTWWTYWWGNSTDQIVWYDEEVKQMTHSPVWHGLRDGNEDAAYYHLLQQRLQAQGDQAGLARLAALTGKTKDASLPMIRVSYDGLISDDIAGPIGFQQFNQAKREVLRMLCAGQ